MKNEMRKKIVKNKKLIMTISIVGFLLICVGSVLISITENEIISITIDGQNYPVKLTDRPFIEHGWTFFFIGLYTVTTGSIFWFRLRSNSLIYKHKQ